ncbi:polysaccharide lyase family 7 protein [Gymnopus androsaceus JB14]|uniref:Polysaccharide lyase family 7 protein n=1 Tax=Gymnopus androsaceus JB14 TaxID=1447944 RepID=A0A6A4I9T4_9AGAR|nr:polysaccharide lyase family 7 protein [Gymnopus androsaceus JB14]
MAFTNTVLTRLIASILLLASFSCWTASAQLNPDCAPGGNFDLSVWELQLPIGSTGSPETITSSSLEGCSGFENFDYFFTESGDGALVMKVPGSPASAGCVTTPNSLHCRTELRETNPSSWSPNAATNRMIVELVVTVADDSSRGTVIGQIHIDDSISSKPTLSGGDEVFTALGNIPIGTVFTYELEYSSGFAINDNFQTLDTFELDAPDSYFKVGNYNQGSTPSDIHVFSVTVQH